MAEIQNINQVVEHKLCHTCGACFAVCKAEAIEFKETVGGYYFPNINNKICTECGMCFSVCSGVNFCKTLIKSMPSDPFTGDSLNVYVGKATDKNIYDNSQSGGIVTALLGYLLESGQADAASVVSMDWGAPPRPKAFLARSIDEIISAQKSKYCPVPALTVIKEIMASDLQIVFVGTSCQVHGLINILEKFPDLKHNIKLIIGLVCDRVMTYAAMDFLVLQAGLSNQSRILFEFRDKSTGGYPGDVHFKSDCGKSIILPAKERMRIKDLFTPARCRICFDKMNVYADIVVGDPHGINNSVDHNLGESIAILRTTRGLQNFRQALEAKAYLVGEISYHEVLGGQNINAKRKEWRGYIQAWEKLGCKRPNYYQRVLQNTANKVRGLYLRKLKIAISLDKHSSRAVLLDFAKKQLLIKNLTDMFLLPVKSLKRVLHLHIRNF